MNGLSTEFIGLIFWLFFALSVSLGIVLFAWYLWALSRLFPYLNLKSSDGWIPFYSDFKLFQRANLSGHLVWLVLVPGVGGLVLAAVRATAANRLDTEYGVQSGGRTALAFFIPPVWAMMLASDLSSEGVEGSNWSQSPAVSSVPIEFFNVKEDEVSYDVAALEKLMAGEPHAITSSIPTSAFAPQPPQSNNPQSDASPVVAQPTTGAQFGTSKATQGQDPEPQPEQSDAAAAGAQSEALEPSEPAAPSETASPSEPQQVFQAYQAAPAAEQPQLELPEVSPEQSGYSVENADELGRSASASIFDELQEPAEPAEVEAPEPEETPKESPQEPAFDDFFTDEAPPQPEPVSMPLPDAEVPAAEPAPTPVVATEPAVIPAAAAPAAVPTSAPEPEPVADASPDENTAADADVDAGVDGDADEDDRTVIVERPKPVLWEVVLPDGAIVPQTGEELLVGRKPGAGENTLQVADPDRTMSKLHARIRFDGERLFVTDLGSTNGTLIARSGGEPEEIERQTETPIDGKLVLGTVELEVRKAEGSR